MTLRRLAGYGPAIVLTITLLVLWELYVRASQVSVQFVATSGSFSDSFSING